MLSTLRAAALASVSYTHLDVYKRQTLYIVNPPAGTAGVVTVIHSQLATLQIVNTPAGTADVLTVSLSQPATLHLSLIHI